MLETQRKEAREYSTDKFQWARFDENIAVFASDLGEVKVKLPYDPKQKLCYHIKERYKDLKRKVAKRTSRESQPPTAAPAGGGAQQRPLGGDWVRRLAGFLADNGQGRDSKWQHLAVSSIRSRGCRRGGLLRRSVGGGLLRRISCEDRAHRHSS